MKLREEYKLNSAMSIKYPVRVISVAFYDKYNLLKLMLIIFILS